MKFPPPRLSLRRGRFLRFRRGWARLGGVEYKDVSLIVTAGDEDGKIDPPISTALNIARFSGTKASADEMQSWAVMAVKAKKADDDDDTLRRPSGRISIHAFFRHILCQN